MDAIEKLINKVAEEFGADPHKFAGPARRLLAVLGVSVPAETGRIEPVAYLTRDKIERNPLHQFVGPETVDWCLPLYLSPPLPTKEGWQPIETAPKDGTVILLGLPAIGAMKDESERRVYEGRWNEIQHKFTSVNGFLLLDCATHWMPLPAAPKP